MFEPDVMTHTLAEYLEVVRTNPERKFEYEDGSIRMMTGGTPAHGQITVNIGYVLAGGLLNSECNTYSSDVAVLLGESRRYYPDVSVSCDPRDWSNKEGLESPTVIVEVLSPTTEKTDRVTKLLAYQDFPTIQDIIYVDSRRRYVEHHHRIGLSTWENNRYTSPEDVVNLSSVGVDIPLKDMYRKVHLELEENK